MTLLHTSEIKLLAGTKYTSLSVKITKMADFSAIVAENT